ncbi:MAG: hypothetical protein AAFP04_08140 [Myxococcota bacterium]
MRFLTLMAVMLSAGIAYGADTLIVQGAEGIFSPGRASKWWADGPAVHFLLGSEDEARSVASQLGSLAGAKVETKGDVVIVRGIPEPELLNRLSRLTLKGAAPSDPLDELASAGAAAVAFRSPEGGGSIRATNPSFAIPAGALDEPNANARFEAEVLSVDRKEFPQVILKLRVRRRAADAAVRKVFKQNAIFAAPVLLAGGSGQIDYDADRTKRNLVAYYLERGDRVVVHTIRDENARPHIDWIQRRKR